MKSLLLWTINPHWKIELLVVALRLEGLSVIHGTTVDTGAVSAGTPLAHSTGWGPGELWLFFGWCGPLSAGGWRLGLFFSSCHPPWGPAGRVWTQGVSHLTARISKLTMNSECLKAPWTFLFGFSIWTTNSASGNLGTKTKHVLILH